MKIRYTEQKDKTGWYALDRHLPEAVFEEKVRNRQGYKDCGGFIVDIPGYEQPMEMIMIKSV